MIINGPMRLLRFSINLRWRSLGKYDCSVIYKKLPSLYIDKDSKNGYYKKFDEKLENYRH